MQENVVKIFEVEFSWPRDNSNEDTHKTLLTNYKVIIPKDSFEKKSKVDFDFHSNYNKFNNI